MKKLLQIILLIAIGLTTTGVMAHVPVATGANTTLAKAYEVENPEKTWALYSDLDHPNESLYYTFTIQQGQTIYLSLLKAIRSENAGFNPQLLLFGEGLSQNTSVNVPAFVEQPPGYGVMELQKVNSKPTYEAFGPSYYNYMGEISIKAPKIGVYYVAIYDLTKGGYFSLVVGTQESFTLEETILTPFSVIEVYQWEGQSLLTIFLPHVLTLVVGLYLFYRLVKEDEEKKSSIRYWLINIAGLMFLASGINVFVQMSLSVLNTSLTGDIIITLVLGSIPLMLGGITLVVNNKSTDRSIKKIASFTIIALTGLFLWAGYIIGSVILLIAEFLPKDFLRRATN